jgi:hypothetical protein
VEKLAQAPRLLEIETETCGEDLLIQGYLKEWWKENEN